MSAGRRPASAIRIAVFFGVAFLLAGPWLIRNQLLYSEWLATSVATGRPSAALDAADLLRVRLDHLAMLPVQFWSGFENHRVIVIKLLLLFGLWPTAVAARYWILRSKESGWVAERQQLWGVFVASLGNLAGFAYYSLLHVQGEIRMLFPSLLGLAYLALVPFYRSFPPEHQRKITWGLAICALLPWIGLF